MIESINQIIQEVRRGENLDLYSMTLIAIVIAVLGVFGIVDFRTLSAAILAILAILSGFLLASRKSVTGVKDAAIQLNSNLKSLQQEISGKKCISEFLSKEYPDLSDDFLLAKRISILGTTLASTSIHYYVDFEQALKRGCSLRIVVSDPSNSEVLKMLALRGYVTKDPKVIRGNIENHLTRLRRLKEIPDKSELLEIRTIPYIPPYGIVVIESFDGAAKVYVKLTPFRTTTGQFPSFEVNNLTDSIWFKFFFDQFELFWAASKKAVNR